MRWSELVDQVEALARQFGVAADDLVIEKMDNVTRVTLDYDLRHVIAVRDRSSIR